MAQDSSGCKRQATYHGEQEDHGKSSEVDHREAPIAQVKEWPVIDRWW